MPKLPKIQERLLHELEETRRRLMEAEDTIEAIRSGQVDALVVQNGDGHQLYTLQSADHAYRVFIEQMNEGAVTLGKQGTILYANSQFAAMVGQPLSAVIGIPFYRFIVPAFQSFFRQLVEACGKSDCKGEVEIIHQERSVPVQLSLNQLELAESISINIIVTDLTLQKNNQQLLEDNYRQLELLNRTLEASNHDLQQFASVASHDLQEPLRKILMFGERIKISAGTKLDEREQQFLDKITGAATRMKTLIVDILNYSRLSVSDGVFLPVDLNELVKDLLEDFELVLEEKKAHIETSQLAVLEVNRGQVRQLFQNLVSNALKFSNPNVAPRVTISGRHLAEKSFDSADQADGPFYLISIEDNGIGFEEKYIPNIFSLFERLNAKEKYEGSGIGLAITKKIVEKHSGIMHVTSTPGQGSSFHIILPVKRAQ
ncbi:MAG: PAS domain S-box protein [Niastella sp.]|nr:PAS domain S-box protein [Niastella sp.]